MPPRIKTQRNKGATMSIESNQTPSETTEQTLGFGQPGMTSLGQAMPDDLHIPVLTHVDALSDVVEVPSVATDVAGKAGKLCMIEDGMTFTGNAALQGTCTIAGQIVGNLKEQAGATSQIVITETGSVKGDIFSHKVSVMGACNGTIDASGGSVDLHAKSVVTGHIRYAQLQVNGADLNATLERIAKKDA
jgi:cytoskeletal protein CcmA (bactofilin family)